MRGRQDPRVVALALAAALLPVGPPDPSAAQSGLRDAPPSAGVPVAVGNAARGRDAIRRHGCGVCHRIPGIAGAIGIVGPALDGFAVRPLIAGSLPNEGGLLLRFLSDPPALLPPTAMPAIAMDEGEVRDIAAYLSTLR